MHSLFPAGSRKSHGTMTGAVEVVDPLVTDPLAFLGDVVVVDPEMCGPRPPEHGK